ncbi:MAG: lytic transglycosylase domain-containing protein [Deltaproteobacteria bacterium]|nr:MAG: lytic transglycosylase domain-containing protein [Deltaproteobacteria bacterium]
MRLCALILLCLWPAARAAGELRVVVEAGGVVRLTNKARGSRRHHGARFLREEDGSVRVVLRGGVTCTPQPDRGQYDAFFSAAAEDHGVPVALLKAIAQVESAFDPRARSVAGAEGLMQLMPETQARYGVRDPFDPEQSIRAGAKYLADLIERFGGDLERAVAAYNAGEGAVERYGGVPPFDETKRYVAKVLARYRAAQASGLPAPTGES